MKTTFLKRLFICFGVLWISILSAPIQAQTFLDKATKLVPKMTLEEELFASIHVDDANNVQRLLQKGVDPLKPSSIFPNQTPLHLASWENALKSLKILVKHPKIKLDALNSLDETPLMLAALKGHTEVVTVLLEAGSYPNKTGWTPLHYAATNGNVEIMTLLLEASAYIDAESPNKTTALMMAARSKNILAVKLLLDEGADVMLKNSKDLNAVDFALEAKDQEIAQGLSDRIRKVQARERDLKSEKKE